MVTITHHDGTHQAVTHSTIPDLWHLGMWLKDSSTHRHVIMDGDERARWGQLVLDCWHLAHELLDELAAKPGEETLPDMTLADVFPEGEETPPATTPARMPHVSVPHGFTDATKAGRRLMAQAINSRPAERAELEKRVGQCWDTEEAVAEFEFIGFAAPFVIATRKADGVKASLMFQDMPRYYFKFKPTE